MAPDPAELRRRVRAARALAVPSEAEIEQRAHTRDAKRRGDLEDGISTTELALRLAAAGYDGLKKDTLSAIERGIRALRRQDLEAIARACGLPYAFFTIDFAQLPLLAAAEVSHIQPLSKGGEASPENLVLVLGHVHERLAAIEDELGLRDATRRTGQALGAALDAADAAETEAAANTRDEADASQEDEPARPQARPRTAEQTGG